ncbi:pyruvate kinase [Microbacterium sp. ARD31]|uniref:pyruvate kinase n=1 Tax=Microbacterium sp. ARD31 TaxID=2962576 RepID=UPI002882C90B|nr:pyruvate kinase [Microbacterium sp. ARD31]MDT0186675.1 pyruvate kinase [Microbacterium sp. ARD31]
MRRAKIVCTLGPAVNTPEGIRALVDAGMDVARLNMSHGRYADHESVYRLVRQASDDTGHAIGIFADLQGPKIRLETFSDGPVKLKKGATFTITTRDVDGDVAQCGTTYKGLPGDVQPGDPLLIDDGKVRLKVTAVEGQDVVTEVVVPGKVSDHKGINLPGVAVSVPALSEKDTEDLRWALRLGVDFIALSFVRSATDADDVRAVMQEEGVFVPVIAKIEKPQAIANIDEIVDAFDGVMVARGDLGVECPLEDVPIHQKLIIDKARRNAKPVIVATQMLESMIQAPAPTRAEASDVANAVLDGADAVMLSGETSVGEYPIVAVETMARIVESTEDHGLSHMAAVTWQPHTRGGIIAKAAAEVAESVGAKYVVAFTTSGDSAKRLSRYRGPIPVLAFTPEARTRSQLALTWGVETFQGAPVEHTDEMVRQVDESLLHIGRVREGDLVVIIAGSPPGIPGSTNALRIHRMGDAINELAPAYRRQR